jgi:hypothetical protein
LFVITYQTLSLLTSFEEILLFTNGGSGLYQTEVWALTAYHRALSSYFGNDIPVIAHDPRFAARLIPLTQHLFSPCHVPPVLSIG